MRLVFFANLIFFRYICIYRLKLTMVNSYITSIKDLYREKISDKEAKFLLGKFLMENGVLDDFIYRYKTYGCGKNKNFATPNDVLHDCIHNLRITNHHLSQLFNYSDVTFEWDFPKSSVDWYPIHKKWEKLITLFIDIKK